MTKEKLNELKEALNNAGKCSIVRLNIDGHTVTDFILVDGNLEIVEDTKYPYLKLCTRHDTQLRQLVWLEDHKELSYEFSCDLSKEHVTTVTYCNGKITTVKR